ncbi:MAG: hypothetical protein ACLFMM_02165 [Methanohalobium sp.]
MKKEEIKELAEINDEILEQFSEIEQAVILACRELVNKGVI